jgi:hypothetical protein
LDNQVGFSKSGVGSGLEDIIFVLLEKLLFKKLVSSCLEWLVVDQKFGFSIDLTRYRQNSDCLEWIVDETMG